MEVSQNMDLYEPTDVPPIFRLICNGCGHVSIELVEQCICGGKFTALIIDEIVKLKSTQRSRGLFKPRRKSQPTDVVMRKVNDGSDNA